MKTSRTIYTSFFVFWITLILAGCNLITINNNEPPTVLFKINEVISNSDSSGREGLAIRFYKDGTYCHYGYNYYAYGKFSFNKEKNLLKLEPSVCKDSCETIYYKLIQDSRNYYILKNAEVKGGKLRVQNSEFQAMGAKKVIGNDPFTKELNTWRFKPKQPETATEIKNRTLNYLRFLQVYHEFVLIINVEYLTTGWHATPLKMHYVNGVKMVYSNELTDWYACFYNVEQGNEGYKLINGAMKNSQLKSIDNITERNIDYLKQLIIAIEKS